MSVDQLAAYERLDCLPAFAVTTPWGSPYMIYDEMTNEEAREAAVAREYFSTGRVRRADEDRDGLTGTAATNVEEASGEKDDDEVDRIRDAAVSDEKDGEEEDRERQRRENSLRTRTTALYFSDPEEASAMVDEMKQMQGGMSTADVRVYSTNMARAARQASRLGAGVPTGQPVDDLTGSLGDATIRYRIVPSRRALYYAATKCFGRERVGLGFGTDRDTDARRTLMTYSDLAKDLANELAMKAREAARPEGARKQQQVLKSFVERQWSHMKGRTGVPVFYADGMKRKVTKNNVQIPLYMDYEDLMTAWNGLREEEGNANVPVEPPMVEVFNMMDVVVAVDKERLRKERAAQSASGGYDARGGNRVSAMLRNQAKSLVSRFPGRMRRTPVGDLDRIVFVPSSRALRFKEEATRRGNNKARLPRMQ